jgi:hypothetical protein
MVFFYNLAAAAPVSCLRSAVVLSRLAQAMGVRLSVFEPLSQSDRAHFQAPRLRLPGTRARVNRFRSRRDLAAGKKLMSIKPAHLTRDMPHMLFVESHAATSQECQRKAAECLRLVQTSLDPTNKAILLEMAEAWISFAEQQNAEQKRTA